LRAERELEPRELDLGPSSDAQQQHPQQRQQQLHPPTSGSSSMSVSPAGGKKIESSESDQSMKSDKVQKASLPPSQGQQQPQQRQGSSSENGSSGSTKPISGHKSREFAVSRALGKYRQRRQSCSNSDSQEDLADVTSPQREDEPEQPKPPEERAEADIEATLKNLDAQLAQIEGSAKQAVKEFKQPHLTKQEKVVKPRPAKVSSRGRQSTEESIDSEDEWYQREMRELEQMEYERRASEIRPTKDVEKLMSRVLAELRARVPPISKEACDREEAERKRKQDALPAPKTIEELEEEDEALLPPLKEVAKPKKKQIFRLETSDNEDEDLPADFSATDSSEHKARRKKLSSSEDDDSEDTQSGPDSLAADSVDDVESMGEEEDLDKILADAAAQKAAADAKKAEEEAKVRAAKEAEEAKRKALEEAEAAKRKAEEAKRREEAAAKKRAEEAAAKKRAEEEAAKKKAESEAAAKRAAAQEAERRALEEEKRKREEEEHHQRLAEAEEASRRAEEEEKASAIEAATSGSGSGGADSDGPRLSKAEEMPLAAEGQRAEIASTEDDEEMDDGRESERRKSSALTAASTNDSSPDSEVRPIKRGKGRRKSSGVGATTSNDSLSSGPTSGADENNSSSTKSGESVSKDSYGGAKPKKRIESSPEEERIPSPRKPIPAQQQQQVKKPTLQQQRSRQPSGNATEIDEDIKLAQEAAQEVAQEVAKAAGDAAKNLIGGFGGSLLGSLSGGGAQADKKKAAQRPSLGLGALGSLMGMPDKKAPAKSPAAAKSPQPKKKRSPPKMSPPKPEPSTEATEEQAVPEETGFPDASTYDQDNYPSGGYYDENGEWVEASGYYDENGDWVETGGYFDENGEWIEYAGYYDDNGEWVEVEPPESYYEQRYADEGGGGGGIEGGGGTEEAAEEVTGEDQAGHFLAAAGVVETVPTDMEQSHETDSASIVLQPSAQTAPANNNDISHQEDESANAEAWAEYGEGFYDEYGQYWYYDESGYPQLWQEYLPEQNGEHLEYAEEDGNGDYPRHQYPDSQPAEVDEPGSDQKDDERTESRLGSEEEGEDEDHEEEERVPSIEDDEESVPSSREEEEAVPSPEEAVPTPMPPEKSPTPEKKSLLSEKSVTPEKAKSPEKEAEGESEVKEPPIDEDDLVEEKEGKLKVKQQMSEDIEDPEVQERIATILAKRARRKGGSRWGALGQTLQQRKLDLQHQQEQDVESVKKNGEIDERTNQFSKEISLFLRTLIASNCIYF